MSSKKKNKTVSQNTEEKEVIVDEAITTPEVEETKEEVVAEGPVTDENEVVEAGEVSEGEEPGVKVEDSVTEDSAEEAPVDEALASEVVEDTAPAADVTKVEATEEVAKTEAVEAQKVDVETDVSTKKEATSLSKSKNPKYGPGDDDEDDPKPSDPTPTPDPEPQQPEEPKEEDVKPAELEQRPVNTEEMQKELMTSYKVRYAFSQNSKRYSILKNMTLFNMIDVFVRNRQAFVGCTNQANFDHIKDYVLHNPILYMYEEFKLEARKQFIARLETNTDYVINHMKKS